VLLLLELELHVQQLLVVQPLHAQLQHVARQLVFLQQLVQLLVAALQLLVELQLLVLLLLLLLVMLLHLLH